jgi:HEAT repeat protein
MIKTARMTVAAMAVTILTGAAPAAEPAAGDFQTQIDALKQAENMGRGMCSKVRGDIGKNLSYMGDAPVRPLAELLSSESRDTRWAAAIVLAMIGPEAKAALPALEKTFGNEKEDIGVRVRAARAIADIKGTNPQELYKAIPDVERKIVADSKDTYSSLQSKEVWQKYLAGETSGTRTLSLFHGIADSIGDEEARMMHDLATGNNLKAANQWVREQIASNKANTKLPWMFGSSSRQFPGRLEPDVEAALQEKIWLFSRICG